MTNLRLLATAVASLALGGLIGYKVAEKRLTADFLERLDRETNAVRRMYKSDYTSPQDMVEKLHGEAVKAMQEYSGQETEPMAYHKIRTSGVKVEKGDEAEPVTRKVFVPDDKRGEIYVISVDEHTADEAGYEHVTWSYYAQDGVVTDDAEEVIEEHAKFLGDVFVDFFGEESGDENVVYIRNEVLMIDYEIVRSMGSYVKEVLDEEYVPVIERPSQRINRGG